MNENKKVFKIDVGNIPENEIEDYIRRIAQAFKAQPDLDCGIYPPDEYFLPVKNENDMNSVNYMQVVPDSHFWTDLNQILESIKHHYYIMEYVPKENEYVQEPFLTREYLLIGLSNSKKNGYKLKIVNKEATGNVPYLFGDIDGMIQFVERRPFEQKYDFEDLVQTIKFTLECGINLTNGLKMNRQDIYKRIDGERDYQDVNWGSRRQMDGTPDEEKPVAEWINYIEYHVSKAKEKVYHLDTVGATAELRKVAALAVRAMEIHGCPARQIEAGDGTKPTEIDKSCSCSDCDCKK